MKIYALGCEYSWYLNQLYQKLIEKTGCTVLVDNSIVTKKLAAGESIYQDVTWKKEFGLAAMIRSAFYCLGSKSFYKDFFTLLLFKPLRHLLALKDLQWYSSHLSDKLAENNVSVIHHHFLDVYGLLGIDYIKPGTKVLCSFWGSDLMDYAYPFEYQYQYRALHRADLITVSSYELKEQVLTKFGRELEPKIRYTQFVVNDSLLKFIEKNRRNEEQIRNIHESLNAGTKKVIVTIGNSMNAYANHKVILSNLKQLASDVKERIFLVVPATYGLAPPVYVAEVYALLQESGIEYTVVTKTMDEDELSYLRLVSDIYLHAPVSDAQSATVLETMFAGNVVLTGSFMPYSNFTKAGLKFFTFNDYNEIADRLSFVVNNLPRCRYECGHNAKTVLEFFTPERQIATWLPVFAELSQTQN